ncbi:MAG: hypothetical protein ACI841_000959 [Planctomycetota bacterium]|jgi:hypothetical protein
MTHTTRLTLPLLAITGILWASSRSEGTAPAQAFDEIILVPHVLESVRELVPIESKLTIYHSGSIAKEVHLDRLRVEVDGIELVNEVIDHELHADSEYGAVNALIERLPHELSHRHSEVRRFASDGLPEFSLAEGFDLMPEIHNRVLAMQEMSQDATRWPVLEPSFQMHLDQVFFADAAIGTQARAQIFVDYTRPNGTVATAQTGWSITYLGPFPGIPPTYLAQHLGAGLHAGDLHVHSCHGESAGACSPSANCTAESLQTSGSFSYAQLKSQFQALGLDWYSATDHSYCINSGSEYQTIVSEVNAITDSSFVVFPDIEVSSDEEGSQSGSDLGNTLCLGTTAANHMGAHGISSRIQGGGDGLLGFCDGLFSDVLDEFSDNAALIRSQGGLPIIHHPEGSSFGWNSRSATQGIEANQLHGVEIWNGASQSGQGGNVGAWVDWLLDGRLLYAYSGSDTHDSAFAFGSNHILLDGQPFNRSGILTALEAGRVTVSDGPALVIEGGLGHDFVEMGSVTRLPIPTPASNIDIRVHYDFGAGNGTINVYRGRVGDGSESLLAQSGVLSGSGVFSQSANLQSSSRSWYRAYASGSAGTAYTNPIFFEPGTDSTFSFCSAKLNSDLCDPYLSWTGSPSATAGSGFEIRANAVVPNQNGIFIYSATAAFNPFQGGTLCLASPIIRTPILNSGGSIVCTGEFNFDFNDWIQNGHDGTLAVGSRRFAQYWYRDPGSTSFPTGLTDAVQFTVGP